MADDSLCNEAQYQAIFQANARALRNFLYYKCGNSELSSDLMQEAFLRLWRDCGKVPPEKAKAYLFTVANRLFLDHVKHQQVVLRYQQRQLSKPTSESPEFIYETEEFRVRLEQAIANLAEPVREVFLLNRLEQMTYKD